MCLGADRTGDVTADDDGVGLQVAVDLTRIVDGERMARDGNGAVDGYPENVRWKAGPVVFLGLNVQGSNDNFPYHDTETGAGVLVRSDAEIERQRNEERAGGSRPPTLVDRSAHRLDVDQRPAGQPARRWSRHVRDWDETNTRRLRSVWACAHSDRPREA
jgi:hypothetical protein